MKIAISVFFTLFFYQLAQLQILKPEGIYFSGPVFTVNSKKDTLFIGAGSALEMYKLKENYELVYLGKSHTIDVISSIYPYKNVVFTGNNGIGLSIFNISKSSSPELHSLLYDSLVPGHHLPVIENNTAFFSIGSYGIVAMDVTNPLKPTEICRWKTPDFILSIGKRDSIIFAADRSKGVFLIRFDGSSLKTLDTLNPFPGSAWFSFYIDTIAEILWIYAYGSIVPYNSNVNIAAISLKKDNFLEVMGTFSFASRPIASMIVLKNYAYMACWEEGLKIFDVSNLSTPELKKVIPTNSYTLWLHLCNDSLLSIAQYSDGLWLFNINNNQIVKIFDKYGDIRSIATADSLICSVILTQGIAALKLSKNGFSEYSNTFIELPKAKDIAISDKYLYAAVDDDGIYIYDLSSSLPLKVNQTEAKGSISLFVKDTLLFCGQSYYLATQRPVYLSIWNIKNRSKPVLLSKTHIITQNWPQDRPEIYFDLIDTLLAISCWNDAINGSLSILSISNPQNPQILYQMLNSQSAQVQFIKRNNNILLASAWGTSLPGKENGIKIFRLENNELTLVSNYSTGIIGNRTTSVACSDNYCFLCEGGLSAHGYIYEFELDNSLKLNLKNKIKIGSNTNHHSLKIWKNYVIHAAGSPGLMVFNAGKNLSVRKNYADNTEIKLIPSPNYDYLTINSEWNEVEILNTYGQRIKHIKNIDNSIDISTLPQGCYFVVIDKKHLLKFIKIK